MDQGTGWFRRTSTGPPRLLVPVPTGQGRARKGPGPPTRNEERARPRSPYGTGGQRRILRLRDMWRTSEKPLRRKFGDHAPAAPPPGGREPETIVAPRRLVLYWRAP